MGIHDAALLFSTIKCASANIPFFARRTIFSNGILQFVAPGTVTTKGEFITVEFSCLRNTHSNHQLS